MRGQTAKGKWPAPEQQKKSGGPDWSTRDIVVSSSPLLRGCGFCELSDLKVDAELEEPDGEIRVVK